MLRLIYNGTSIPNLADNAVVSPLTVLYVRLHTADPGEAGDQSTNEVAYTGYAAVAVTRNGTGWVVTGNSVSPVFGIEFPEMTGGVSGTATHASVGTAATGAGKIIHKGALTPSIVYALGVTPRIKNTSTITEE